MSSRAARPVWEPGEAGTRADGEATWSGDSLRNSYALLLGRGHGERAACERPSVPSERYPAFSSIVPIGGRRVVAIAARDRIWRTVHPQDSPYSAPRGISSPSGSGRESLHCPIGV